VTAFLAVIVLITLALCAPWATRSGKPASVIDALFTATSSVCVTGLESVPTHSYWSSWGHVAMLAGIQVGGLGVMTIGALFGLLVTRRIGLTQRLLAASETKGALGQVGALVRVVAAISVSVELIIALFLFPRFLVAGDSTGRAAWHALFYGVSAFNNAGLAPTSDGLAPFVSDVGVLLPVAVGVFIGALGFPVLMNISRRWSQPRSWTLHTKLTLTMALVLAVIAPIVIGLFEWRNPATLGDQPVPTRVLGLFFAGVAPKTSGFTLMEHADVTAQTSLVQVALMLVGGGSASTAGGIKVTTLAVMLLAIRAEARGDRDIEAFGRRIPPEVLRAAVGVVVAGIVILFVAVLLLLTTTSAPMDQVIFEAASAFATCGLTTGLSATLPVAGKLTLIALMLIGRLGTMTLAAALALTSRRSVLRWPAERPLVG